MAELPFLRDLVVLLLLSLGIVLVFQRLRQPSIVGFLAAGVVLGPHGLSLVREVAQVELLAEVGVILLLFTLGLEFSLSALAALRRQVLVGGGLQAGLTLAVAVPLALTVADWRAAVLIGSLVALSSTAIALKLLMERGDVDTPYGRAAVGILLLQDLLVIPMMLGLVLVAERAPAGEGPTGWSLAAGLVVVGVILAAARWLIPNFLAAVVRTRRRELFVLTVVLICLSTAWATNLVGLSLALGAFLAGVAVSESEYGAQALADVLPLRDTFSSVFFISIGMLLDLSFVARRPVLVGGAVLAVLAVKALTGVVAIRGLGLPLQPALLGGFAVAQLGEFSFVLAAGGVQLGVLDADLYQVFVAVAVTTMFTTPFMFLLAERLGDRLETARLPGWILGHALPEAPAPTAPGDHVVIAGYGLNGRNLARVLREVDIPYLIADTNPELVWAARARGEPIVFGDVTRREVLEHLRLDRARALVVALSDPPSTRRTVAVARAGWPDLTIVARTRYLAEVELLHRFGADEVIPEEFETSIEIFAKVLATYDVPRALIIQKIEQVRREHYAVWRDPDLHSHRLGRLRSLLAGLDVDTYRVTESSHACGRTLAQLDLRRTAGATTLALVRDGTTLPSPGVELTVQARDTLVLLGTNVQVELALALLDTGAPPPSG